MQSIGTVLVNLDLTDNTALNNTNILKQNIFK